MSRVNRSIKHHVQYIYVGVVDFYVSLWFYALHRLKYTKDDKTLSFEQFHYYYISCFPFFYQKHKHQQQEGQTPPRNISYLVLGSDDGWLLTETLPNVRMHISLIYTKMFSFWHDSLSILSDYIHLNFNSVLPLQHADYRAFKEFFASPDSIRQKSNPSPAQLTIAAFQDHLGPYWYWFHFRHITIPLIRGYCEEYDALLSRAAKNRPSDTTNLWRMWFQRFDARVRDLSCSHRATPPGVVRAMLAESRACAAHAGRITP